MNALMTTRSMVQPLPSVLDAPPAFTLLRRRKTIGEFRPASADLERFNQLLARLGRNGPLAIDQLATAARQLSSGTDDNAPGCIAQRISWLESVAEMVSDPAWRVAANVDDCARLVAGYAADTHDLIPDWLPRVGRLDDAIVADTAWPTLHREVACYRDFLRLHALEAGLSGRHPAELPFDRAAWESARDAEAALIAHRRRVRESSYVPATAPMFRIH